MKKFLFIAIIFSALFGGCDYVDTPHPASVTPVTPTNDTIRKILIEDFTGHTCPNCPSAKRMMDSLRTLFPGQIIGMAVHIDFFAEPCPTPHPFPAGGPFPSGAFGEDFRIPLEDADYNAAFGTNSFPLPAGLVNRFGYPASIPTNIPDWPTTVANILAQPMTAYLKVTSNYNSTTRQLTANVSGEFMVDTTGTFKIALFLVEDGFIGYQTDLTLASGIDPAYEFNDVFRGCINTPGSISGDTLATGAVLANTQINYTTPIAFSISSAYNDANCRIVAILYNSADYGVLQAAECDL